MNSLYKDEFKHCSINGQMFHDPRNLPVFARQWLDPIALSGLMRDAGLIDASGAPTDSASARLADGSGVGSHAVGGTGEVSSTPLSNFKKIIKESE